VTTEQHADREAVSPTGAELQQRLDAITSLCRRYNQPGSSPTVHFLANRILQLADPETKREFV
jgi:hypothetical protein